MSNNKPKQSSLLSFFGKSLSAKSNGSPKPANKTPVPSGKFNPPIKPSQSYNKISPDKAETPPIKRRRVVDSDEEGTDATEEETNVTLHSHSTPKLIKSAKTLDLCVTPKNVKRSNVATKTPAKANDMSSSFLSAFESDEVSKTDNDRGDGIVFKHLNLDFLKPEYIKDKEKRPKSHIDYDPRTLYIPDSYMKTVTPAIRQWWIMKTDYFDTILFFKVGKFYELYHMDAVVAVTQLNLTYMKGEYAHCGFPEIAYGRFADQLLQRGYKVGRVEQTETPQQMTERAKTPGTKSAASGGGKAVRRELCRVTTPATLTHSFLEQNGQDMHVNSSGPCILIAIKEHENLDGTSRYGICFVDTTTAKFHVGEFLDDEHRSQLRTAIAHNPPAEVLYEKHNVGAVTQSIFNGVLSGSVVKEGLHPKSQFLAAKECLQWLVTGDYFKDSNECNVFPEVLLAMVDPNDPTNLTPRDESQLGLSALGAVVWYLHRCMIDHDLLSMGDMNMYYPPHLMQPEHLPVQEWFKGRNLVLDGSALRNLNIVSHSPMEHQNSLFHQVDFCSSAFGRRLLRQWLNSPLCDPELIVGRQQAVQAMMECAEFMREVTETLKALPDLERALQRMHTLGLKKRADEHPDGRAVMFENDKYNKRKLNDLMTVVKGLDKVVILVKAYNTQYASSLQHATFVHECLDTSESGLFPDIENDVRHFEEAFDWEKAKEKGVVEPKQGINDDYDQAMLNIKQCKHTLEQYLEKQKKILGCSSVIYFGSGRNRFQLEIPESVAKRLDTSYEFKGQRKGYKRFVTCELVELFEELQKCEADLDEVIKDIMRTLFADFASRQNKWRAVVKCMAVVDVVVCLAQYAKSSVNQMCVPQYVTDGPLMDIKQGVHPSLCTLMGEGKFIPNDTLITPDSPVLLITGANMGGKSTVMRQCALLVVLAQIGSLVPAESMRLSPVDRVFTRIGACDRILCGQSTFYVEMSETKVVLRDATVHSLVVMDELGRGTATHDGTAIAHAVLQHIGGQLKCRTLFSTHYHSLADPMHANPAVKLVHMACMVENENSDDPTQETVTFLYQMTEGRCPKSYGFHAAKLAGIPISIIRRAHEKSKEVFPALQQ